MELTTTSQSLSYANLPKLPALFPTRAPLSSSNSINFLGFNCTPRKLKCSARQLKHFGAIHASVADSNSTNGSVTWLLEFIGDGDTSYVGSPTAKPRSLQIPSGAVTVGRVAEKADVVIPVPTVSAVHAQVQNMEEYLVVTDLDSTNGTFIGEKRLKPGVAAAALPGSLVTFGTTFIGIPIWRYFESQSLRSWKLVHLNQKKLKLKQKKRSQVAAKKSSIPLSAIIL